MLRWLSQHNQEFFVIIKSRNNQQGAAVVFVLMVLIALLAVAVVFLSRLTQKDQTNGKPAPVVLPAEMLATPVPEDAVTTDTTIIPVETPAAPDNASTPEAVIPPPPPPP